MNIQNINFKKVFLLFFAAFLLFSTLSFAFAASDGGWGEAVRFEQNRLETRERMSGHEERTRGRAWRAGRHDRALPLTLAAPLEAEANRTSDEMSTAARGSNNHLLRGLARAYVRVTSPDFGVFDVFGHLFRVGFTLLLALWVYADSKKYGRNTLLWTTVTVVTSLLGLVLYLLVHTVRKAPAAKA